ncbi:MAG: DUF262 domain-containing protein [Flavobacteriaceae bacterium]|nr:DUF262 domain-containing protein [Flavobacteriaceae bacterium]
MSQKIKRIKIREIIEGYQDHGEEQGVIGYGGKLNIRPPYQREYLHENNQKFKEELIQSIYHGRPIGLIYFAKNKEGNFELMDGQQRIITICKFCEPKKSFFIHLEISPGNTQRIKFHVLEAQKLSQKILDYELMVYEFEGTDIEKLNWFRTINKEIEVLSDQEIRNSVYHGRWLNDAKKYFTHMGDTNRKEMCNELMGSKDRKRHAHLEKIIQWKIGSSDEDSIMEFMATESEKDHAKDLWDYFRTIWDWQHDLFGEAPDKKLKEKLNWGRLYATYGKKEYSKHHTKGRFQELYEMYEKDEDTIDHTEYPFVQIPNGIYEYILSGEMEESRQYINRRTFNDKEKRNKWKEQNKLWPNKNQICKKTECNTPMNQSHGDHIKPYSKGGRTVPSNLQILCADCNRRLSNK